MTTGRRLSARTGTKESEAQRLMAAGEREVRCAELCQQREMALSHRVGAHRRER